MPKALIAYLTQRSETATFMLPSDLPRALADLFPRPEWLLPQPYKIFLSDETRPPLIGFPVAEAQVMKDLESRLDRWLSEEVAWQVNRTGTKEKAQQAFTGYLTQLMKVAENAMLSNLLSDYHGVFWLLHSFDLSKHFAGLPRRISVADTQVGKTQGDQLKYRLFAKWVSETRDQMVQLATRVATTLDGEEQRGLQFFRLLQDDVLILTEDFVGPDLRELRSFFAGYLRRDFQAFRDSFEKIRTVATDLVTKDKAFRNALPLVGGAAEQGVTTALLMDNRFQSYLFEHPAAQSISRDDRELLQSISRRVREFTVLNQLRRGIHMMAVAPDGAVFSAERRTIMNYSRSTRPMDFGRPGVVDPMVHRFGLMYDISAFSETLGSIARGGRKEEISSYRQMLLFQRKMETIASRHRLQFEKFLGDGAFYTTRQALRLVGAAIEIQRFYSDMRRKGFAFNKGLRIALNYGYYRLLPMKGTGDSSERMMEFYGPGIVELSRLTTGKANKEIEEIQGFLMAHGYEQATVQQFFAPLARGVDVIDHKMHNREFYAYVNASGHLVNEGIVASFQLAQELSPELQAENQQLFRLTCPFGSYIGFALSIPGVEYIGLRIMGMTSLKGLDQVEVCEITPFAPGEASATPLEAEALTTLLRQEYHAQEESPVPDLPFLEGHTHEEPVEPEVVVCISLDDGSDEEVLIGQWDPLSDEMAQPLRIPKEDFRRLFAIRGPVTTDALQTSRDSLIELYHRLCDKTGETLRLSPYRYDTHYEAFLIGESVEKLE
jgi:hypothetical protein